jgi:hypothetical protein
MVQAFPINHCLAKYGDTSMELNLCLSWCVWGTPINTPIFMIRIFKTRSQLFIIPLSLTFPSFPPVRVAILGDFKYMAHAGNGKKMTMLMQKLVLHGWGCAKMLMAFLKISLISPENFVFTPEPSILLFSGCLMTFSWESFFSPLSTFPTP